MPKASTTYIASAVALFASLTLAACGRGPETGTAQTGQPDTVVTSRSDGKAVANPRRGSFKKSDPNAPAGYMSPEEVHRTTPEPHSTYTQ